MTIPKSICLFLLSLQYVHSLFFPEPRNYQYGEKIELKVGQLTSTQTDTPIDYYSLPFCAPEWFVTYGDLGNILGGEKIQNSLYNIHAMRNVSCRTLCARQYNDNDRATLHYKIEQNYKVHWFLDDLPVGTKQVNYEKGVLKEILEEGLEVGPDSYYLYNHHDIKILYNEDPQSYEGIRIVGFEVTPKSLNRAWQRDDPLDLETCVPTTTKKQDIDLSGDIRSIVWTYSVSWEPSTIQWEHRWDRYGPVGIPRTRWVMLLISAAVVLRIASFIMKRKLTQEIRKRNSLDPNEEAAESSWFALHGDVFRPPERPMVLSVLVGAGAQVFATTVICLVLALVGELSPTRRGLSVVAFVLEAMGFVAGYTSTRFYKQWEGKDHLINTALTSLFLPGTVIGVFLVLHFFGETSSPAFRLVFFGSFYANKQPTWTNPVRNRPVPRPIPKQPWYLHPVIGGIFPFSLVFTELFFINAALWGHQHYSLVGFMLIVFVMLVLLCAEIAITMIYFQLCSENHRWWWNSFLVSGSSALYAFLYSVFHLVNVDVSGDLPTLMYFGYAFIMSLIVFVLTGSIGFGACYLFVRKMFASVKRA